MPEHLVDAAAHFSPLPQGQCPPDAWLPRLRAAIAPACGGLIGYDYDVNGPGSVPRPAAITAAEARLLLMHHAKSVNDFWWDADAGYVSSSGSRACAYANDRINFLVDGGLLTRDEVMAAMPRR